MTRLPPGITLLADAFGTRWVPCQWVAPWLYAEHVGHVAHAVPVRVLVEAGRADAADAERVRQALRQVGYESVVLVEEVG